MENEFLIKYSDVEICQQELVVLKNVNFEIKKGEFVYFVGRVGSGKSSLMKSFYGEVPVEIGEAMVLGFDMVDIKNRKLPALRRKLGIVFQDFKLLFDRTVEKNLEFVLKATGWSDKKEITARINEVLAQVGMSNKGYKMPHELSGGEQQRIVIARALLNKPDIVLADEPTGNLDQQTGKEIMDLLFSIVAEGTSVIMATHNLVWLESYKARVCRCENGLFTETSSSEE
ncbi:MAG: ATP-binding cassette domain-containing protein [Paludibacteraceae bacterium]|nr:ATP-binding cassette domain-containing protein [Paludibacteraceae bacterium]